MRLQTRHIYAWLAVVLIFGAPGIVHAQQRDRLAGRIDNGRRGQLAGSRNYRIEGLRSQGPLADATRVTGLSFRFRPTPEQSAELERLLKDQQNPSSSLYHAWLTPEEYGERFGLSTNDLAAIANWIVSEGFQVDAVARSRNSITFSGTAAQMRNTFHVDLHRFQLHGQMQYANVRDPELPADLQPLVYTFRGLDDFRQDGTLRPVPQARINDSANAVTPGDLAVIYNLTPLFEKGITGAGQKIVVAGQAAFDMADVQDFRTRFSLPRKTPQVVLVPGSPDPGVNESTLEAILGLEYAGASAPEAELIYVYSQDALSAVQYAIDQNLAPVINYSFGTCERNVASVRGTAEEYRNIAQQANAQGITWIASSGDTGPAACETQLKDMNGSSGMFVNVPVSLPEVTGVGGTSFGEGDGAYWNASQSSTFTSARSYIPETAWNDTASGAGLAASGGGQSILYARPDWQTGSGVPGDSVRHVPDISFTASWDHDPYLIVQNGQTLMAGGSSVAAPFFAGVLALLNQHLAAVGVQSKPGLGNINPALYQLAQTTPSVFHDIVTGDNIIPCSLGTLDCTTGTYGFKAGPGYDHVTGLGSLDIKGFLDHWTSSFDASRVPTTLSLTAAPSTFAADHSTVLTARVAAARGTDSPTGTVVFSADGIWLGSALLSGSGGAATATINASGGQLGIGDKTIVASYAGTGDFTPSAGSATVTVSAIYSEVVPSVEPSPVYKQPPDKNGYAWFYTLRLTETAGVQTTVTSFVADGADLSTQIASIFGNTVLSANGTLSVPVSSRDLDVPLTRVYLFGGVDPGGRRWSKQLTVRFLGEKDTGARMVLTSDPAVVVKTGTGDPRCSPDRPLYQQLTLRELNGVPVNLTKFVAAGFDYTSQIPTFFGSRRLPASGTLQAEMCWQINSLPITLDYEIDGIDATNQPVQANLQVEFRTAQQMTGGGADVQR